MFSTAAARRRPILRLVTLQTLMIGSLLAVQGPGRADVSPAWPALHQNLQRTGATTATVFTANPRQVWRFNGSTQPAPLGAVNSPVLGSNGVVYITATHAGSPGGLSDPSTTGVLALDAVTGAVKWSFPTGPGTAYQEDVKGPPAIGPDGTIYVDFSDQLVALKDNGASASVLWTYMPETMGHPEWDGITDGPTVGPNGHIYVPTGGGFLGAIAPPSAGGTTGTAVWAFQTAPSLSTVTTCPETEVDLKSLPAIATDGSLYVGSDETQGVL
jgi:outer membrane protein assembly factor BamB